MDLGRLDHVVVVEHQRDVLGEPGEVAEQLVHDQGDRRTCLQARKGAGAERGLERLESRQKPAPETHRVVVADAERQPGHRQPVTDLARPGRQSRRLPKPGWRGHQRHRVPRHPVEALHQPGARHQARANQWRAQVRRPDLGEDRALARFELRLRRGLVGLRRESGLAGYARFIPTEGATGSRGHDLPGAHAIDRLAAPVLTALAGEEQRLVIRRARWRAPSDAARLLNRCVGP